MQYVVRPSIPEIAGNPECEIYEILGPANLTFSSTSFS